MNLLVVDVGNTNIVLGIYRGEKLIGSWRLATARERTADEYGILAKQLIGDLAGTLDGAIVSSVVPPLNRAFEWMIEQHFKIVPLFVEPGVKTGIAIHVDNPQEVGADRIVNCVAAFERYGGPSIIVDFGTATTFDVVTANAEYVGGVIAPGINISAEALFARASRLPRVEIRRPPSVVGTNTVVNMQSGLYFGYLGLVDGILARIKQEVPGVKRVVASAAFFAVTCEPAKSAGASVIPSTARNLVLLIDVGRVAGRDCGRR